MMFTKKELANIEGLAEILESFDHEFSILQKQFPLKDMAVADSDASYDPEMVLNPVGLTEISQHQWIVQAQTPFDPQAKGAERQKSVDRIRNEITASAARMRTVIEKRLLQDAREQAQKLDSAAWFTPSAQSIVELVSGHETQQLANQAPEAPSSFVCFVHQFAKIPSGMLFTKNGSNIAFIGHPFVEENEAIVLNHQTTERRGYTYSSGTDDKGKTLPDITFLIPGFPGFTSRRYYLASETNTVVIQVRSIQRLRLTKPERSFYVQVKK